MMHHRVKNQKKSKKRRQPAVTMMNMETGCSNRMPKNMKAMKAKKTVTVMRQPMETKARDKTTEMRVWTTETKVSKTTEMKARVRRIELFEYFRS